MSTSNFGQRRPAGNSIPFPRIIASEDALPPPAEPEPNSPIIEAQSDTVLLPDRVARGLAAGDRVKYYLSLLHAADRHAQQPHHAHSNLRGEREASSVVDGELDGVVHASRLTDAGEVYVPESARLLREVWSELALMLQPITGIRPGGIQLSGATDYGRRRDELRARTPDGQNDRLPSSAIDALTRVADARGDTVQQLVQDLDRELRGLRALTPQQTIEGARAYGLGHGDRVRVTAFMRGINDTAWLKFDHPGLDTTAIRIAGRLSIQNDIVPTAAHVMVLHLEGLIVTIVYSDVHARRLEFLRGLLEPFSIGWRTDATPAGDFHMIIGRHAAPDERALERFLTFIGSRLVFLIDWNRARRRLKRFVTGSDAVAVLRRGAEQGVGHCAFLALDGPRLIEEAMNALPAVDRHARLNEVLGRQAAKTFLASVMNVTCDALRSGRSERQLADQIEAELLRHMVRDERGLIEAAAQHATYVSALADRLQGAFLHAVVATEEESARTAALAQRWEEHSDDIVRRWLRIRDHAGAESNVSELLTVADDVADALEEAAFLITLVPASHQAEALAALQDLPELVCQCVKEYARCLDFAKQVVCARGAFDVEAVRITADRIAMLERQCDAAECDAQTRLMQSESVREVYLLTAIVHRFEESVHALARCAVLVKGQVLHAGDRFTNRV